MFSSIWIGTRRRRRRGMFDRYHSIENNDDRDGIWSFAVTYGDIVFKTISECELLLDEFVRTLQFSFSNGRFFVGDESDKLKSIKSIFF
jgi:hypothetical protein